MKVSMCKTMRTYEWKNLSKDLLAGLVIMAVSIPISMGYAQIAGLPAVYGLYGSVFPIVLFALFSTSPQFVFGVDAAPAALVGSALVSLGIEGGSKEAIAAVPVLAFFVAVWLLVFCHGKSGCFRYWLLSGQWIRIENGYGRAVPGENSADRYRGRTVYDCIIALRNRIYRVSSDSGADSDCDFSVTGSDRI